MTEGLVLSCPWGNVYCPVPCGIQAPLPACSVLLALEGEDAPRAQAVLDGGVGMV